MDYNKELLISVVIPAYNVEDYIEECIASVISQSYKNIEIVCVDDGSTDRTADILNELQQKEKRLVVIHQKNGGVVKARKVGKQNATGDYLLDLDGDDWIEPDRIQTLIDSIDDILPDVIYMSGMYRDTKDTNVLSECYFKESRLYIGDDIGKVFDLFADTNKTMGKMLFRNAYLYAVKRELAVKCQNEVLEEVDFGDDAIFTFNCFNQCDSIQIIYNPTYHYRQTGVGVSHGTNINRIKNLATNLRRLPSGRLSIEKRKDIERNIVYWAMIIANILDNTKWIYPYSKVPVGAKVVVYGAGGTGYRFVKHLLKDNLCNVVAWLDKRPRKYDDVNIEIKEGSAVTQFSFEYILIAIINEDVAKEVRKELIELGVDSKKIVLMDKEYMKTKKFLQIINANV